MGFSMVSHNKAAQLPQSEGSKKQRYRQKKDREKEREREVLRTLMPCYMDCVYMTSL